MSDWTDIGALLRKARNNRRWSLQDVAHLTRIPIRTLHDLEENDYSGFPSPAYAKSFLAQYSEYVGVDAVEWLDAFEVGNVLDNLDSYGYLKDHDEHLGEEPSEVPVKQQAVKSIKKPARPSSRRAVPAANTAVLQPLVVFAVTATMITGAVFGFLRVSDNLADQNSAAIEESDSKLPKLQPLSGIPDSRPAPPEFANAARAVPASMVVERKDQGVVEPLVAVADPGANLSSLSRGVITAPATVVPTDLVMDGPPPRAVIVDE